MRPFLNIDLPTWWFLLTGAVFTAYAILDGFDMGAGALHLFYKKSSDRKAALNAVGPFWDGNEVYLVIGGGALFAGFPRLYGALLTALYVPIYLFLFALIFRAVSIEFRSKRPGKWWQRTWDTGYFLSSIFMALLLGLVFGNVINGFPVSDAMEIQAGFATWLRPYPILMAVTTLSLFMMHGAIFLLIKSEKRMRGRTKLPAKFAVNFFIFCYIALNISTFLDMPHMTDRIRSNPILWTVPVLAGLIIFSIPWQIKIRKYFAAFLSSSLSVSLLLILAAVELYPDIIYSIPNPDNSITIYSAAASEKSLGLLILIAIFGAPLAGLYTMLSLWTFKGTVEIGDTSY